jgi:hypothetical protein
MSNYRKIVEDALKKSKKKTMLNEGVVYPDGLTERMHEKLEEDLVKRTHSLGEHTIFPEGDESTFEEKIMGERFAEVVNRYKRYFDTDKINNGQVMKETLPMVYETMGIEAKHKKALEKLAVEMIREEYNMSKDVVEIHAELTDTINMEGTKKNPKPMATEVEFKNHDELMDANEEVYKRRFINSMIQGAAKKCNHMFHMVDDKLIELDPRLPNKYAKMMSAADYMYYIIPDLSGAVNGGVVRVQFPTASNPKAVIHAQAMVLPVLIHELVKGVMELISAHGLPKKKRIGEYVINKADFLAAEPWDMRIGPGIWSRFTKMIDPDDFNLKHHIYMEMVSLPVREFNVKMREIMAGTKEGKKIIDEIVKGIKAGLQEEEFNEAMNEISSLDGDYSDSNSDGNSDTQGFDLEELMGGIDGGDSDGNSDNDLDGYNFEDLFN